MRVDARILTCLFLFAAASFVVLSGGLSHAQGQPAGKVYRIGFMRAGQPPKPWVEAFQQGLRELGYVEGQNMVVEVRYGSTDQLPQLAEELVRLKVDVILAGASSAAVAAKKVTASVPIVFVAVSHPVEIGLVPSLARPGGNITGTAFNSADFAGKRLELLREIVPTLRRVAVLSYPPHATNAVQLEGVKVAARTLGIQLELVPVRGPNDFDAVFTAVGSADGLLYIDTPLWITHRARLTELAARSRLPAIYGTKDIVEIGGLMSYGPHIPDLYRRAATHVDKILKGTKPGDLPVEQPTKFELAINNKTAKVLGLTIPPSLRLRADHIVE